MPSLSVHFHHQHKETARHRGMRAVERVLLCQCDAEHMVLSTPTLIGIAGTCTHRGRHPYGPCVVISETWRSSFNVFNRLWLRGAHMGEMTALPLCHPPST